ncbi:hypothetical protein [Psychroserpens sp.]|jgi:hypothetical protein|uniref:hypothetical protein n=1 Tax=Psychroserpens sp. TaxID=2020870 RepID=UPI0039E294FF
MQSIKNAILQPAMLAVKTMEGSERVAYMKINANRFGIPDNGFKSKKGGGGKLYQKKGTTPIDLGQYTLASLIKKLSKEKNSNIVSKKLAEIETVFPDQSQEELFLALVTSWREGTSQVMTMNSELKHTYYDDAGLDFLWEIRTKLELPSSILSVWEERESFINPETDKRVFPGAIPARDFVLAYAATNRFKYNIFERHARRILGEDAGNKALANLNPDAHILWTAFAFLRPGGRKFGDAKGQSFGAKALVGYLLDKATSQGYQVDLNEILTDQSLHKYGAIRNAKARAAETVFLQSAYLMFRAGADLKNWFSTIKSTLI